MALIKIQGKANLQGKTIFDAGVYTLSDADAISYIAAVEAADKAALEDPVKKAIDQFVIGCKSDGIWNSLKASCILAGARTLNGALVPLVGTAPTNFNFVSADYDRKTGLKGNGTTKRLNPNRAGNVDPQNNCHMSVYRGEAITSAHNGLTLIGSALYTSTGTNIRNYHLTGATDGYAFRARSSSEGGIVTSASSGGAGFLGVSRSASTSISYRTTDDQSGTKTVTSQIPSTHGTAVFCLLHSGSYSSYTFSRLSFYSIGESVDLTKLDNRVSALMTAINAAI